MLARLPDGLELGCVLPREDPRDAFVSRTANAFDDLPRGALIGTSSPRRRAQVLTLRPDLHVTDLRGNVDTRLKKLGDHKIDATFLAVAGLRRLGLEDEISEIMPLAKMLPAGGQGAIGIEVRTGDSDMSDLLSPIGDTPSHVAVTAERAFLEILDGSCKTPLACHADVVSGATLSLTGQVLLPDGSDREDIAGTIDLTGAMMARAAELGRRLGAELKSKAGEIYFEPE